MIGQDTTYDAFQALEDAAKVLKSRWRVADPEDDWSASAWGWVRDLGVIGVARLLLELAPIAWGSQGIAAMPLPSPEGRALLRVGHHQVEALLATRDAGGFYAFYLEPLMDKTRVVALWGLSPAGARLWVFAKAVLPPNSNPLILRDDNTNTYGWLPPGDYEDGLQFLRAVQAGEPA